MSTERLVYTTYIATTPDRLWRALIEGELTRQYWKHENVSDWKSGSRWEHVTADGERRVRVSGTVIESVPGRRLVLSWSETTEPAPAARHSRVTFDIEQVSDMVRLTVVHEDIPSGSETYRKVVNGWPRVLSSLKTLLETGAPLNTWA